MDYIFVVLPDYGCDGLKEPVLVTTDYSKVCLVRDTNNALYGTSLKVLRYEDGKTSYTEIPNG